MREMGMSGSMDMSIDMPQDDITHNQKEQLLP